MKILFANPNTTAAVTDRLAATARRVASPGTEVVAVTAPYGVPYIATRAEAVIGGRVALEMLAEHGADCDAAVIAAFADPGAGGARELFPFPVIGMAEAAMLTACMLGRRFSIVTFATAMEPWYRECADYNGLSGRLASIRCVPGGFRDINTVQDEKREELTAACCAAVHQDMADVVILGGAPLSGLAWKIAEHVPVPLVDGAAAALRQAEVLAALKPRKATAGSFRTPDAKPITGVTPALARYFTRDV
jgi:Asp/Glu/hydantoin racemase